MNRKAQIIEELFDMKEEIKVSKSEWIETVIQYDDLDGDMEDIWG